MSQSRLRSFINPQEFKNFRRGFMLESKYGVEDPTFLSFNVEFNFAPIINYDTKLLTSPLFSKSFGQREFGAIEYLNLIGYKDQSDNLNKFTEILQWIQDTTPWFFQSIDGLDEVWRLSTDISKNMQTSVLTFNCLESVDLRMTFLADLYRKSIYDTVFMRELVPENLRFFQMSIQVCEFRNIRATLNKLENVKQSTTSEDEKLATLQSIVNELNYIEYVFDQCEFDFSESFPGGSTVSNMDPAMASNKFKIKVNKWQEKNSYPYFDMDLKQLSGFGPKSNDDYTNDKNLKDQELKIKAAYTADNFGVFSNAIKKAQVSIDNLNTQITNAPANLIGGVANQIKTAATGSLGEVYPKVSTVKPIITSQNVYDQINKFIPPNAAAELGNIYKK